MAGNEIKLDAGEIFPEHVALTIKIKGMRRFIARVKVAMFLFNLAARVLGCPVAVTMTIDGGELDENPNP